MDQIRNMMDQLSELSDEQIVELQNDIISEFEMVEGEEPTPQTVEAMTSLADMLDSVRSEVKNREVQAKELAQQATEAVARVHGEEASVEENIDEAAVSEAATEQPKEDNMENEMPVAPEEPVAPAEETTPDAEAAPAEAAEKVGDETPEEDKKDDEEEEPVMASAEESTVEETASVEEVIELSTEDPEVIEEAPAAEEAPAVEAELAVEETVELSTEESIETPDVPVAQEEIVEAP